jgi:N-acetylglucosaminyldiphosphoundecaprenol N-acetyl-beta-D-mannosaminyltransferase
MTFAQEPAAGAGDRAPRPAPLPASLAAACREGKHDFLGIGLSCLSDEELVDSVSQAVRARSRLTVSFINSEYVLHAHRTAGLMEKINRFDIVLPDGWSVVYGGRWLGLPVPNRQANDDISPDLFALSEKHGFSNFLFGCSEGTADRAGATLRSAFPRLPVAGTLHGYWDVMRGHPGRYDAADIDMMVETINASGADILHVSLPTPIQQNWVWDTADRLNVPVIITAGAYLDHLAERVDWYPRLMNRTRLSWAYRLSREPVRLWKRYSLGYLAYGRIVLRAKLGRR